MKASLSAAPDYSTRRKRRAAVNYMVGQLELIATAEEAYKDNIPLNLLSSDLYDTAEEYICLIDEALDALRNIY